MTTSFMLILITLLTKILGMLREIVLSYFYGASYISDAYLIAIAIPQSIIGFFSAGIGIAFIPIYTKIFKEDRVKADRFVQQLMSAVLGLALVLSVILLVFTEPIVKVFASGFEGETLRITQAFVKITSISVIFTSVSYVAAAYMRVKEKFLLPQLISLVINSGLIASILVGHKYSIYILPLGVVFSYGLQLILMIVFLRRIGFKISLILTGWDTTIQEFFKMTLPIMIGVSITQLNLLIDKTIASGISEGAISALNYASRIELLIQTVFVIPIITIFYTKISKYVVDKQYDEMSQTIKNYIELIAFFVIPATVGMVLYSDEIVSLIYYRGAFDKEDLIMTSSTLFFYSFGIIGLATREIFSRIFYAFKNTKTPMLIAGAGMVLNIILNILLSRIMGIRGLALATSISAIITGLMMMISFGYSTYKLKIRGIIQAIVKIVVATIVMGLISMGINIMLQNTSVNDNLSFMVIIGVSIIIYVSLGLLLRIRVLTQIKNHIFNRILKSKY